MRNLVHLIDRHVVAVRVKFVYMRTIGFEHYIVALVPRIRFKFKVNIASCVILGPLVKKLLLVKKFLLGAVMV